MSRWRTPLLWLAAVMLGLNVAWWAPRWIRPLAYLDLAVSSTPHTSQGPKTVCVTIRHETFSRMQLNAVGGFMPRSELARFVRLVRKSGAKALGFDYYFGERNSDDAELAEAISEDDTLPIALPVETPHGARSEIDEVLYHVRRPTVLPLIRPAHVTLAHAATWDPDAIVRGVKLFVEDADVPGTYYPHLAAALLHPGEKLVPGEKTARIGDQTYPIGAANEILVKWGPPTLELEYSEAVDMLKSGHDDAFKDAIVILGSTNQGNRANDIHVTADGDMNGTQLQAQAVRSLSLPYGSQVKFRPDDIDLGFWMALTGCVAVCVLNLKPRWWLSSAVFAGSVVFGPLASRVAMASANTFVSPGLLSISAAVATGVCVLDHASRHVPAWVRFGWRVQPEEMVALFVDVENSTGILAELKGSERTFFERIHALIAQVMDARRGDIERTMGDGAFIVFRGVNRQERCRRCLAAMEDLRTAFENAAEDFVEKWGVAPRMVMGAEVVVVEASILESRGRQEFTTFGRDIAYAQRVQTVAKHAPSRMAVGRQIAAEHPAGLTPVEAQLKGFDEIQTVYHFEPRLR